ncbi:uncharacterized protein LOC122852391 isoform X2 [Aphidius gifuensis]|uniref:uncharacterized protein LOC122852391 isoform X2 n=1 Tax=Aphidius gifuensis TaxID=684658 RepID=UPI001CDBE0D7|nr:uncharacterized protein LOC122852391 isoform X2 [Aphidius gifuensis]
MNQEMTPWLMAICCLMMADCMNVTDQETSESQHDQVAILKQIRKVNDDGSYTFGYEAGDGSFKVETRDVLGNVKGTFGFVDANGEIKRVTYTSSNGTGFKATTLSPLQEQASVVQSIPRTNRSTTKKPTILYATSTSTESSSSTTIGPKSNVVQTIPRIRKTSTTSTTSSTTSTTTTTESPKPIFGHYLKTSKNRPKFFINNQQKIITGSSSSEEEIINEDSQLTRPSTDEKINLRKIIFPKRPIDQSLRPITEEFEEKEEEEELKATTGNALRRQLHEDTTKNDNHEINNDEHSDVYGGALSTARPLFTTSSSPKIIQRIRSERPKMLYQMSSSVPDNIGPARFDNTKYEAETKTPEERETTQPIVYQTVPSRLNDRDYARQTTEQPVYVRREPEQQLLRDLSSGVVVQPTNIDDEYRAAPVGRYVYRPQPRPPVYPTSGDSGNVQYLSENPAEEPVEPSPPRGVPQAYIRQRPYARPYNEPDPRSRPVLRPIGPMDEREYPEYYRNIALPPEAPNPIAPPLSRRDFQMLLRRLLITQYGLQALAHPRSYLEDALYDEQPYTNYQTSAVRPNVLAYEGGLRYNDRTIRPILSRIPIGNIDPAMYSQRYSDDYQDPRYMKRVYRQKLYTQDMNEETEGDGDEILPPPIREALLLRMLQLAISTDRPSMNAINHIRTTTIPTYRKSPVRNVQIISDEQDKETIKKL